MGQKNGEFLKKLRATFQIEAEEHIQAISSRLLELERSPAAEKQSHLIETVFREAHSLKGAARAVNFVEVETICQSLESVFAGLKRRNIALSPGLFDVLHTSVDTLRQLLTPVQTERPATERSRVAALLQRLENAVQDAVPPQPRPSENAEEPPVAGSELKPYPSPSEEKPPAAETVRVQAAKLDSLFLQAEELLSAKLSARQRAAESREICTLLAAWERERAKIHSHLRALRRLFERDGKAHDGSGASEHREKAHQHVTRILGFLEWNDTYLKEFANKLETLARSADHDHRTLGRMVDDLLGNMRRILMLPFGSLLEVFPKLVRDLSRDRGKDIDLVVQGGQVHADRRLLEEMKDPLVHLIRNSIDHGIEHPRERQQKAKLLRGTITMAISSKAGDKLEILISDDGAGIDVAKVRAAVIKAGVVPQEDAEDMDD